MTDSQVNVGGSVGYMQVCSSSLEPIHSSEARLLVRVKMTVNAKTMRTKTKHTSGQ